MSKLAVQIADSTVFDQICDLIQPFYMKKGDLTAETKFSTELILDSLAVMDLIAEVEEHFNIILPINRLPDIETVGEMAEAVEKALEEQARGSLR